MAARRDDLPGGGAPSPGAKTTSPASDDGRVARFHSQDGLSLAVRFFDCPATNRLPLLCLPGLSRNSREFIALGRFFSRHPSEPRRVIAVDYRGRGLSDRDPDWSNYKPIVEAQDALAAAATFGIEQAILVGTSRGGIIAMLIGALRPALIAGVVLNDIGPIIEGRGLARIKSTLSIKKRSVTTWDDAVAAVRAAGEAQFPELSADEWRAVAAAYYGETRHGLAPEFDRESLEGHRRPRRDGEGARAVAAVHEPCPRAGPRHSRRALRHPERAHACRNGEASPAPGGVDRAAPRARATAS